MRNKQIATRRIQTVEGILRQSLNNLKLGAPNRDTIELLNTVLDTLQDLSDIIQREEETWK